MLVAAAVLLAACQSRVDGPGPSAPAAPTARASISAEVRPPGLQIVGGPFVAPVEACAGRTAWTGVPALVIRLADAWHEPDFGKRRAILDEVWAVDGLYQDPFADPVRGRDGLNSVMGYGVAPGQYLELTSWDASDMHHGAIRMAWRHCCPSGLSIVEGTDLATLDADGRIARIVSFWRRYVEEPAEGACDGTASPVASPIAPTTRASGDPAAAACKGPDVDWSASPAVAAGYGRAWNERDTAARRAILEEVWADSGSYGDPTTESLVAGREAFVQHLDGFLAAGYGEYFEPLPFSPEGDVHHGFVRMPWVYCDGDANVVWTGEDIAELDEDGKIIADLGFFVP